jgi:hypothetical protein
VGGKRGGVSNIAVAGSVVSSIAPRMDLAPQLERIISDHLTRFRGVPVAVWLPDPRGLTSITVCHHTLPVYAGWPTDPEARKLAYLADHAVAVVYPGFGEQS